MALPRAALLALAALPFVSACSADGGAKTVDVYVSSTGETTGPGLAPTGSAKAGGNASPKHCSGGSDKCATGEICCRAATDKPVVEYCAPRLTDEQMKDNSLAACGAIIPDAAKHDDLSVNLAALECVDSGDCKADEICVSGAWYSSDSLASKCMPKKGAYGLDELCGRGTCKLGKSACRKDPASTSDPFDVPTCEPTTPAACGKATCKAPQVCVGSDKGLACGARPAGGLSEGAVIECTANAQCAESQVCCIVGGGQLGSHCGFSCDVAMERYTCGADADCKGLMEGMTFKCKPETDQPLKGTKTCQ